MTERERMLAGELYDPADPELVARRCRAREICLELDATGPDRREHRMARVRELFGSCGERAFLEPPFRCDYGANIHVGDDFYANFGCVFLDVAEIRIGHRCLFGPQVGVYTATHPLDPVERASGRELARPIAMGNDCWIGGHATICPGVVLGDAVVVGAGAVVTRSFGSRVVLVGNPARVVREIP